MSISPVRSPNKYEERKEPFGLAQEPSPSPIAQQFAPPSTTPPAPFQFAPIEPLALPRCLDLENLAYLTGPSAKDTLQQIEQAKERGDYFDLKRLFEGVVANEWRMGEYNYDLRCEFFVAFSSLCQRLALSVEQIQKGEEKFQKLSPEQRKELLLFCVHGRGAESIRLFAKILLPLSIDDKNYDEKMIAFAENALLLYPDDLVPGLNLPLKAVSRNPYCRVLLKEPLLLDERVDEQASYYSQACAKLRFLSDQLSKLNMNQGKEEQVNVFTRGMVGAGIVNERRMGFLNDCLGIQEENLLFREDAEDQFGGFFARHETIAINERVRRTAFPYVLFPDLNIRLEETQVICSPPPNTKHIVLDTAIEKSTVTKKLVQQAAIDGGELPSPQILEETYRGSVENRAAIVDAARKCQRIEWYLYDNNGDRPVLIASIADCKLRISNQVQWMTFLSRYPRVAQVLGRITPVEVDANKTGL